MSVKIHSVLSITSLALLATVTLLCAGLSPARGWDSDRFLTDTATDAGISNQQWIPPISGATPSDVLRGFDGPSAPWSSGHRGIDIAGGPEILAPASGTVEFSGKVVDRSVLTIKHPNGLLSSFEPITTELEVGDAVSAGQVIGHIEEGIAHCEASCLHWGVRIKDGWHYGGAIRDRYIDPQLLLGWAGPSVLWPVKSDPWWA